MQCLNCGTEFSWTGRGKRKHCSERCRITYQVRRALLRRVTERQEHPKPKVHQWTPETKTCVVCESPFQTKSKSPDRERYCSPRCRQRFWNQEGWKKFRALKPKWEAVERRCAACSRPFWAKSGRQVTCSLECSQKYQDAKRREITVRKWDQTPRACLECGKSYVPGRYSWRRQKYCTKNCAMRVAHRRQPQRKSRNLPVSLRRATLQRASHCCQRCGSDTLKLEVHHRDWDWRNNDLSNLVVLCRICHDAMEVRCRVVDGVLILTSAQWDYFPPDKVRFETPRGDAG